MLENKCMYCKPPKRKLGCHDECPDYKEYRRVMDEANAKRKERSKMSIWSDSNAKLQKRFPK